MQTLGHADRTRERVTALLLTEGPATAASLSSRLGLTPAGVRRHLEAMVAEGSLVSREQHPRGARGRGRPARVFALSDSGHDRAPNAYDDLALAALTALDQRGALQEFAGARARDLERRYAGVSEPAGLAAALSADGYGATVHPVAAGTQLCQHHCPVSHAATSFPALCDAETAAISRLLGTHVQRLATIAHGDGVCTTYIPHPPAQQDSGEPVHDPLERPVS